VFVSITFSEIKTPRTRAQKEYFLIQTKAAFVAGKRNYNVSSIQSENRS